MILAMLLASAANGTIPSTPDLGKAEARCRDNEDGPAFLIEIDGLRDRQGLLKLEVYPATTAISCRTTISLIKQGKVFRRVELPVPRGSPVRVCVRVPRAGAYAVSVLHDRDANHRFGLSVDGIGFGGNPRLGCPSRPPPLPRSPPATDRRGSAS